MKRIRLTIRHNSDDAADDLRYAARVRRDLWAHSPVEVNPDGSVHGTHRDAAGNAYFEFATDYEGEVERVLSDYGHRGRVSLDVDPGVAGPECINCGNIAATELWTVCPNCDFRDISPCPHCHEEVARQAYEPISGDLFRCPRCGRRVRLRFQDPMFDGAGEYNQPFILIDKSE